MKGLAYNPSAISEEAIDIFANHAKEPGGLRPQFEHFRAFPMDAEQNKESAKSKITMPVLVLGGDIYPALGGDYPGNFALEFNPSISHKCNWHNSSIFGTLDSRGATTIRHRAVVKVL